MAGDANYASVSLLLHGDGTNGSTTFTDSSPTPKTATVLGNAQISTAQSKFGGASMAFDGYGDYITFPDHADFEFSSGNFTIEAWVRMSGYPVNNGGQYTFAIVQKDVSGTNTRGFSFSIQGTSSSLTGLSFTGFASDAAPTFVDSSFSFSLNTWYHIAAVRSGNLLYLFVDGTLLNAGGASFNITIQNTSTTLRVGALDWDATYKYYLNGYLDDLRITKGVARYTAAFTPDARAFPNGLGEIEGVVRDSAGALCSRTVRAYRRDTGVLAGSAVSDATTGAYLLATPTLDEVTVIALDNATSGTYYNDQAIRVIPA